MPMSGDRVRRMKLQHQAEGYLELAWRSGPRRAGPAEQWRPGGYANLVPAGEALRALERCAEALEPLGRVAEAEAENVNAWLALGWCHKRTGRLDLAIDAMEAALAADPEEPLIHYNLACYWSLAGGSSRRCDTWKGPWPWTPVTAA